MYDLKNYLRNVYELESSVYQQTQAIQDVEGRISRLPVQPKQSSPTYFSLLFGGGFIIGLIWAFSLFASNPIIAILAIGFFGFLTFCGLVLITAELSGNNKMRKEYSYALSNYNNGQIVKRALDAELPGMRSKLSATQSLLQEYYSKGILHCKYQNLVAVSYLLDCIDTGRCTQLDGPDGAYNQYELEVRMDRISSQLDTVITKLDQIRQNQLSLYNAITEANRINSQIVQKLDGVCSNLSQLNTSADQIRRSLNVANHTAELNRKELAYRNYLDHGTSYSR